jgi:hypothetical protein
VPTYAYDVLLGQMERARTQDDVDRLVREYSIYVRGLLEDKHPSSEVTAERIVTHVGKDIGWMLGEIGHQARERILPMLPEQVQHPIMGRDFDVSIDEMMLAGAAWAQGLPRGGTHA